MRTLKRLYIAGNGLSGNLETFEMPKLTTLIISSNRFTGTLATNIKYHKFEVFDISSNQITGYLNTNGTNYDHSEFRGDINRFSGPVNSNAMNEEYAIVEVLSGNSISCNTLPSDDPIYTESVLFSDCETRQVFFSIIIWCIALGFALVIGVINCKVVFKHVLLWVQQYKLSLAAEIIQSLFPRTIHIILSMQKLHKVVSITSLSVIVALVAIYSGFEFSENSNKDYKVQFEKYNYAFSGIFLKSVSPAVVLYVIFTFLSMISVYIVYRVFLIDWAVESYATIFIRPQADSSLTGKRYNFGRYFVLFLFLSCSLSINVAYVYGLTKTEDVLPLQLGFFICNSLYHYYGSNWFLAYLSRKARLAKIESAMFHATIMTFSEIINPCLATLVIDSNCFRDYWFTRAAIDASYSYSFCDNFDISLQTCLTTLDLQRPSSFTPPFIYGHQCRDRVFGNYIPIIFLSCAFNTFVYPILYFCLTSGVKSLSSKTVIFSFLFDSRGLVFEDTIVHFIEGIIFNLLLMILFGIAYPLCFVLLVIDITSRIYLLIRRLLLYIELCQRTMNNNIQLDKENSQYLENLVSDAVLITPYLIWPGLGAASFIFGLYIFDMAWDTEDNEFGAPIVLLLLTIISYVLIFAMFFKAKAKIEANFMAQYHIGNLIDDKATIISSIDQSQTVRCSALDIDLRITENPIQLNP
jgi:hypothetical protein